METDNQLSAAGSGSEESAIRSDQNVTASNISSVSNNETAASE